MSVAPASKFATVRALKFLRLVTVNVALAALVVVVFDVVAYFVLPATFTVGAYRVHTIDWDDTLGGYQYPRTYYVAHPTRGFDTAPSNGPTLIQRDYLFPIERNQFGCRDKKSVADIPDDYIYVAGDSNTWGIVPSEYRWTEGLSDATKQTVLNCGVSGTAQMHQHEKYDDVVGQIGHLPRLVLVGYVGNDVYEDFVHPGRTILDGYLVDEATVVDDGGRPRRQPINRGVLRNQLDAQRVLLQRGIFVRRIGWILKEYSLSAQIAVNLLRWFEQPATPAAASAKYEFDVPLGEPNKNAILSFAGDVCKQGARFSLLILPDTMHLGTPNYFAELAGFLSKHDIHFLDLHKTVATAGHTAGEMALIGDPHFSVAGNAVVAAEIVAEMQKQGNKFGRCPN